MKRGWFDAPASPTVLARSSLSADGPHRCKQTLSGAWRGLSAEPRLEFGLPIASQTANSRGGKAGYNMTNQTDSISFVEAAIRSRESQEYALAVSWRPYTDTADAGIRRRDSR